MIAIYENSHYYYAVKDHLGSNRVVLNGSDSLVAEWNDYLTFGGTAQNQVNPDVHYRYTGQEQDNDISGNLYNYRARFYDSELGKFLAVDPAHQYYSPFTFVGNNPVSFVDPTGMLGGNDLGKKSAQEHNESNGFAARAQYNHMRGFDTPPAIYENGILQDAGAAQAFFSDPQAYLSAVNAQSFSIADASGTIVAAGQRDQVWVQDGNSSQQITGHWETGPMPDGREPGWVSDVEVTSGGHYEANLTINTDAVSSYLESTSQVLDEGSRAGEILGWVMIGSAILSGNPEFVPAGQAVLNASLAAKGVSVGTRYINYLAYQKGTYSEIRSDAFNFTLQAGLSAASGVLIKGESGYVQGASEFGQEFGGALAGAAAYSYSRSYSGGFAAPDATRVSTFPWR